MSGEQCSPFKRCRALQSLINITYEYSVKPLREVLKKKSNSVVVEIQLRNDENKVYDYISSQISIINNASEEDRELCLKEFPKSEICYQCIGIDDDTIQGLLKIREISFLEFLEVDYLDIVQLLTIYCVSEEDISSIGISLYAIKDNLGLFKSCVSLADNSRNLIDIVNRVVANEGTEEDNMITGLYDVNKVSDPPVDLDNLEPGNRMINTKIISLPDWMERINDSEKENLEEDYDRQSVYSIFQDEIEDENSCLNSNQSNEEMSPAPASYFNNILCEKSINHETLKTLEDGTRLFSEITTNDDNLYLGFNQITDSDNSLTRKALSNWNSDEMLDNLSNLSVKFPRSPRHKKDSIEAVENKSNANYN